MEKYDFSGWCTRTNLKCSDGRTILKDAFKGNDGQTVPLVWNHQHNDPFNVLGAIREVSLVLAGANPGAYIDSIISHGEESDEEAIIYTGEDITLSHAEDENSEEDESLKHADENKGETNNMAEETKKPENQEGEETVEDVWNTLSEKQKTVVYAIIGQALEDEGEDQNNQQGEDQMKQNVFDKDDQNNSLSHDAMNTIIGDAKRYGSMKESFLAHAQEYGIENVDYLFSDGKAESPVPGFIKRDTDWVAKVMAGVTHSPFSRIKSIFADITEEDARAKGYIKGNLKKDEVFSLLKRTTTDRKSVV